MNNDPRSDYPVEDIFAAVFSEEEGPQSAEETHLTFWSLTNGLLGGEPLNEDQLLHIQDCDECIRRARRILARHCPDLSSVNALVKLRSSHRLLQLIADHVSHCERDCTPELAQVLNAPAVRSGTESASIQPERSDESAKTSGSRRLRYPVWLHRAVRTLLTSEYQQWFPASAEAPVFLGGETLAFDLMLTKAEIESIVRHRWASAYDSAGSALVEGVIANSTATAIAPGRSKDRDEAVRALVEAVAIIRTAERLAKLHMTTFGDWPSPAELTTHLMETDAALYVSPETLEHVAEDLCGLLRTRSPS